MALFELGNKVRTKQLIVLKIHPILERLCARVNETVNLAQIYNNQALYLDKIESQRSLQIQTSVGNRLPLHCSALGKSILATLPREKRDRLLSEMVLAPITRFTITRKSELIKQIEIINTRGYSVDNEEFEEGLKCVAVPLHIAHFDFFGAISLSGPSFRFTPATIKKLANHLKTTVEDIKKEFVRNNKSQSHGG
jgi:DNA-binding IclR family transcriptional regulator